MSDWEVRDNHGQLLQTERTRTAADHAAQVCNDHEARCRAAWERRETGAREREFLTYHVVEPKRGNGGE